MNKAIAKEIKMIVKSLNAITKLLVEVETEKETTAVLPPFDESPLEQAPKVDRAEVRKILSALAKSGKATKVRELLSEFGVVKLSEIPDSQLMELKQKAEAI